MQWVAFVRNVNLGQRGHPSTDDLLSSFAQAGCTGAWSFQSNGTVVFGSDRPEAVELVMAALAARSGFEREIFAMPSAELVRIASLQSAEPDAARRELTLHGGGVIDPSDPETIREASRRRCAVISTGDGWAVLTNERDRESNATPVVEHLVGAPATSRGLPTLLRLAAKLG